MAGYGEFCWASEGCFCWFVSIETMRFLMVFCERDLFFEDASLYLRATENNVLNGIDYY